MQVFLYEWATGGGLVDQPSGWPASLVREGAAMLGAVAADFARIAESHITVLRDPRVLNLALPGCEIVDVQSAGCQRDEFERLAAAADATLLVAPEFDNILWKAARAVERCGGRLVSPSSEFIRIAADKERTCAAIGGRLRERAAGNRTRTGRAVARRVHLPGRHQAARRGGLARYVSRQRAARFAAAARLAAAAGAIYAGNAGECRVSLRPGEAKAPRADEAAFERGWPLSVSGRRTALGGRPGRAGDTLGRTSTYGVTTDDRVRRRRSGSRPRSARQRGRGDRGEPAADNVLCWFAGGGENRLGRSDGTNRAR